MGAVLITVITFFCTSYIPNANPPVEFNPNPGEYELLVTGSDKLFLQGNINYNTNTRISEEDTDCPTLHLVLHQEDNPGSKILDLYLAHPELTNPLTRRSFNVSEEIRGFVRDFEGVFGIADIDCLGELPFFSKKGQIEILDSEDGLLAGFLNIQLSNALGEIIQIEGNFKASRQF